MNWVAGVLSGILGALGVGGGGVLIIYLVVFMNLDQITAQGINLLFFLPCGLVAIIIHAIKKRIRWATVLPCVIGGAVGVLIGTWLLNYIGSALLRYIFAAGLILLGIKELVLSFNKSGKEKTGEK